MSGHCSLAERIRADAAKASERFPGVQELCVDGELVSFSVEGKEFSAVWPEAYGCTCEVYGPDDFLVCCQGSLCDIVAAVLQELEGGHCTPGAGAGDCEMPPSPGALTRTATAVSAASDAEGAEGSEAILTRLRAEIAELEDAGFSCTVDAVLSDAVRVTLCIPIRGLLSKSTSEAWGFDRERPLCVSLAVDEALYARSPSARPEVSFWQEKTVAGFEPLDAGVQLKNIVKGLWQHLRGVAATEVPKDFRESPDGLLAKKASIMDEAQAQAGVLLPMARYMMLRLPCLHEYCVICDEPLVFPPMVRPTVCTRTLCCYSARAFGAAVTGEFSGTNANLEVWDLLVAMAICAGRMDDQRMRLLFSEQNFPSLFLPGSSEPAFSGDDAGRRKLRELMSQLHRLRARFVGTHGISWFNAFAKDGQSIDEPLLTPLIGWIWDSNRSYVVALSEEERIQSLGTEYQYLLLSAPPEMESSFQDLKKKHGATFCFHGSSAANWHCILRQGLKNASGSQLMTCGQAHGPGIYLARDSATSANYSSVPTVRSSTVPPPADMAREVTGQRIINPDTLTVLAICEVAEVTTLRKNGNIWVCPDEAAVVTRFLLAYPRRGVPNVNLGSQDLGKQLAELTMQRTAT